MSGTSPRPIPSRGHRLALAATAVVTVGLVSAYASAIGAQTSSDLIRTEVVSVDGEGAPQNLPDTVVPAISDTGGIVVYETAATDETAGPDEAVDPDVDPAVDPDVDPDVDPAAGVSLEDRRVWIRDRIAGTSRAVAEAGSVAPGVSGNGCLVAYTVVSAEEVALTLVDRCATEIEFPLPVGTVLDTDELDTDQPDTDEPVLVAPPSLSFDGSTIVWSTGREVRRYARPADGDPHVRSHTFDAVSGGSPDVVTGIHTDVSADGRTIVFVAGPGTAPFAPAPADVYSWTLATPQLDPELISATSSGDPALSDSTSPTIAADASFVVFESSNLELPVVGSSPVTAPFVVGVDRIARTGRILVDDARRPTVSADGNHVVYQRGDAVRVLSSVAESTIDHEIDELADAGPTGALSISQFGRWIMFGATIEPEPTPAEESPADESAADESAADESSRSATAAPAVWAVDRASSNPDVVDTTTTTTTQPPAPASTAPASTAPPPSTAPPSPSVPTVTDPEVQSLPTVPATTLLPTVIVPRFPTVTDRFPSVGLPAPGPVLTSSSAPRFDPGADSVTAAFASPVTFEPTVAGAGRRTESVILTNAGSSTLQVASTSIDLAGVFAVVGDTCSGVSVAPGSSCAVEVEFAPTTVGPLSAVMTFVLGDGSPVTATLDGEGVPEPTLDVVPAVGGAGQTVTVFGAGFPPGSTVELSRPGSSIAEAVAVGVDGTFAHVIVVLPNTPAGSAVLSVHGQPNAFDDARAELLVSTRRAASADAALRGGPAGSLGR